MVDDEYEMKMLLEIAKEKDPSIVVGDYITEEIESVEFGRIVAQTAKQMFTIENTRREIGS